MPWYFLTEKVSEYKFLSPRSLFTPADKLFLFIYTILHPDSGHQWPVTDAKRSLEAQVSQPVSLPPLTPSLTFTLHSRSRDINGFRRSQLSDRSKSEGRNGSDRKIFSKCRNIFPRIMMLQFMTRRIKKLQIYHQFGDNALKFKLSEINQFAVQSKCENIF